MCIAAAVSLRKCELSKLIEAHCGQICREQCESAISVVFHQCNAYTHNTHIQGHHIFSLIHCAHMQICMLKTKWSIQFEYLHINISRTVFGAVLWSVDILFRVFIKLRLFCKMVPELHMTASGLLLLLLYAQRIRAKSECCCGYSLRITHAYYYSRSCNENVFENE